MRTLTPPLVPFVDRLPLPSRLIAAEHDGQLNVRMRAGEHRFHRDLPVSSIWGFEGTVPGPSIEAERGQPVTVEWRNELEGPFPAPDAFHSEVLDTVLDRMLVPATTRVEQQRRWVTWMQRGHLHAYLFFILATLVTLLLWKGGS